MNMKQYNKYSILALSGVVVGIILLILMRLYGHYYKFAVVSAVLIFFLPFVILASCVVSIVQIHKSKEKGSVIVVPLLGFMIFWFGLLLWMDLTLDASD